MPVQRSNASSVLSGTPGLFLVQRTEQSDRQNRKIIVRQVLGHRRPLDEFPTKLDPLGGGKLLHLVKDVGDGGGHGENVSKTRDATSLVSGGEGATVTLLT